MSDYDYLGEGLLDAAGLRSTLVSEARRVADLWLGWGLEPAPIEVMAELLARMAQELGDQDVPRDELVGIVGSHGGPEAVGALVEMALGERASNDQVAAIAVHLLDIAEAMALRIFVPELPALSARADRSGDAARNVGIARYLRG